MPLYLSGDRSADALLETDAFALLIGMVLDQQVPMERAFSAPAELKARLGGELDVEVIAGLDPERLRAAFAEKPALHRFPGSMADRVQQMARMLIERFDGDAASVWSEAGDGAELLKRLRQLPGFGEQKARIFIALLAKRLGVRPMGWEKVAGSFGDLGSFSSIADIDGPEALQRVRDHKRDVKAAMKGLARLEGEKPKAAKAAAPAKKAGAKATKAKAKGK